MRIGVVSDTHNNLKSARRIVELFNAAGVAHVIHTGDITQAKTLDVFARLHVPLTGVFGNNDEERDALTQAINRHGFAFVEPPLTLTLHGRRILVTHDPYYLDGVLTPQLDLVLHGHTHRHRLEQTDCGLIFNPGECAGHMPGLNAIGVVDLDTLATELIRF
jgi:putative phosphoesterase